MVTPVLSFDLGSPYAYLAAERAEAVLGIAPDLEPILLGAIFAWRGGGSWAEGPERAAGQAEVEARAERYGLPPIRWPAGWPGDGLAAMRAATYAVSAGRGAAFVRAAFRCVFADGADIADPAVLDHAAGAAGLEPATVRAAVTSPVVKEALRSVTRAAWEAGVRGVPTLRIGTERYFGDDQLPAAAAAIQRMMPVCPSE